MRNELRLTDIPLPDNTIIERQVLLDAVNAPESITDIEGLVKREYFTDEKRAKIWDTIISLFNSGSNVDSVSVYAKCGKDFIREVINAGLEPGTPTVVYSHAKLLRDSAIRRCGYLSALRFIQACADGNNGEEDIYAGIQQLTFDVQGAAPLTSETNLLPIVNQIAEDIQTRGELHKSGKSDRITTGFQTLDYLTYRGWGPGQLIVLAARPSIGKTAVMLQMAKSAAMMGFPTMVFSLEMTKKELGQRLLYSTGLVQPAQVMAGNVDWRLFEDASGQIANLPFYINDESRTLQEIVSKIVIAHQRNKCSIAFIDYLGLIRPNQDLPLYQAIADITRTLKDTAMKNNIPIVLLCQLNRLMVKENRAPELYDLRDSGSIEQDADIVLMLEQQQGLENTIPDLNMWVRKNRQNKKEVCISIRPNDSYSKFIELGTT